MAASDQTLNAFPTQRRGTWVLPPRRKTDNSLMITRGPNADKREFVREMVRIFETGNKKPEDFNFRGLDLKGVDCKGINLRALGDQALREINFTGANLSGQDFSGLNLQKACMPGALLLSTNFSEAKLDEANMENVVMGRTHLYGVQAHGTYLNNANMKNSFIQGDLRGAQAANADMSGTQIGGATTFENARMRGVNMTGVRIDEREMEGPCFIDADLTDATLRGTFRKADFTRANMANARLEGGNFEEAMFSYAMMTGARINAHSNFREAAIEYAYDFPTLTTAGGEKVSGEEEGDPLLAGKKAVLQNSKTALAMPNPFDPLMGKLF